MVHTTLVCHRFEDVGRRASDLAKVCVEAATQTGSGTPVRSETHVSGPEVIGQHFETKGFSKELSDFLMGSWRESTVVQYRTPIQRWLLFCDERKSNPFHPLINDVLEFLLKLFKRFKLGYSSLNMARSALSTFICINDIPVGQHPLVKRFMRSVFNKRPSLPKYNVTWDVTLVLNYLKTLSPVKYISVALLTKKLVMLMLLLSGQRGQSIHLLDVRNMTLTFSTATFRIADVLKTTKPGSHVQEIAFKAFAPDRRLCVVTVLKEYLKRTLQVRKTTKLLLTTRSPVHAVSRDTIRRWTKDVLKDAGIDLSIFAPHSTRSAVTSKVALSKLPLRTILRTAGWARECTFRKYYNKPVDHKFDFGDRVLS